MRTTSFDADNTQGASGINAFVTPPTASTSFLSQVAVAPIESSISRNKAGDRAPTSLWIQRLKSRDNEPETFIRETLASNTGTRQGLHIEKSNPVTSARAFGTFSTKAWVNKTMTENKTAPEEDEEQNKKKGALNETRQRSSYQGGEKQQNTREQGRGGIIPLPLPSNRGFGHQIGQNLGAKLERNASTKSTIVNMKVNPEPSIIPQTYTQPVERKCEVSHAVKAQAEGSVSVSSLGKPPLPPAHSKFRCPPKPSGYKSLGFPARSTTRIASSPANGKVTEMPIRYPSHIEVMTDVSAGPLLKEGCQAKEDALGCQYPLSKEDTIPKDSRICPRRRIGKSLSGSVSCSEGVSSSWMYKPPKKIARQDLEAVDVAALETGSSNKLETMKLSHKIGGIRGPSVQPGGESSIAAEKGTNGVLKSGSMQKPVSGQAKEAMKATPRSSTTASFPWEMFAGAAGPSRSAREDFVEVYNRARDELKNQKASLVTKVSDKEMENCPGRATSFRNTSSVIRDRQTSERQVQQEILEKLKKVTGSASQPEGVNTTVIDVDITQDEQFSERRCYMNFLEGEADINPKQNSQAFQNIQVTSGKDSISLVRGRQGGPLHGYVELLVVPKDCNLTLEKGSECKQDFASSMAPERCEQLASTGGEVSQPKLVEEAVKDIKDIQSEAPMLLSKRQREVLDSSPFVVGGGRESVQRERLPSRSEFWLQRWYPPPSRIKVFHEHKLLEGDRTRQDLAGCSTGNVHEDEHRDTHGACDKATGFKQKLIEKGILFQRIAPESEPNEHSKRSSEKVLPSAAAMAIVGTAAREFCNVQPQRKGSFAFWSGFRVPASKKPEHSIEKGKRKLPFEADSLA